MRVAGKYAPETTPSRQPWLARRASWRRRDVSAVEAQLPVIARGELLGELEPLLALAQLVDGRRRDALVHAQRRVLQRKRAVQVAHRLRVYAKATKDRSFLIRAGTLSAPPCR